MKSISSKLYNIGYDINDNVFSGLYTSSIVFDIIWDKTHDGIVNVIPSNLI